MKPITIILSLIILASCGHKPKNEATTLRVYSGAGLTDAITELCDSFKVEYKVEVALNLASSGTLARQIEFGARPDVYISASMRWANYVDSIGCVVDSSIADVVYNDLALIAPSDSELDTMVMDEGMNLKRVLGDSYMAIGNPAHVPAGKYAKQTLEYYHQYAPLQENLLMAKDVRSALRMVEMGEAALGLVYYTDALRSTKVKVLAVVPEVSHTKIRYVACLGKNSELSKAFYTYVTTSEKALPIWAKYGFKK